MTVFRPRSPEGNGPEGFLEGRRTEDHVGDSRRRRQVEESVEGRAPEIQVDEDDAPPGPGEGDAEVGRGRRLPLALERARHEDRPRAGLGARELEGRAQLAEGLGRRGLGIADHHERSRELELRRRRWDAAERRSSERRLDLLAGADAGVVRLGEVDEAEAEHDAAEHAEHEGAHRPRRDLGRVGGGPQDGRAGGDEGLGSLELRLRVAQLRVEGRGVVGRERVEPRLHLRQRFPDRARVHLRAEGGVLLGVGGGEPDGDLGAPVDDGEPKHVGVRPRRDVRVRQQPP